MRKLFALVAILFYINSFSQRSFEISCSSKLGDNIPDGRLLLLLSNNDKAEPRFQISDGPSTQLVFGMDVDNSAKGRSQIFTPTNRGHFWLSYSEPERFTKRRILCAGITSSL